MPGRGYHPGQKCWTSPYTQGALGRLERLFCPASPKPPPALTAPERSCEKRWISLFDQEQAFIVRVEEEMKLRGYSPKTRKSYRNHLLRCHRHFRGRELAEPPPRPRGERKLPTVMSRETTQALLNAVDSLKHQTLLVMVCSAGLRVGEVVRLMAEDIDALST